MVIIDSFRRLWARTAAAALSRSQSTHRRRSCQELGQACLRLVTSTSLYWLTAAGASTLEPAGTSLARLDWPSASSSSLGLLRSSLVAGNRLASRSV